MLFPFSPVTVFPCAFCIRSQWNAIKPTKSERKTAKPSCVDDANGEFRKLPGLWFLYDIDPPFGVFLLGGVQPSKSVIASIRRSIFLLAAIMFRLFHFL